MIIAVIFDVIAICILLSDLFWVNKKAGIIENRYNLLENLIIKNENSLETIEMMNTKVKRMEKIISAYEDDLRWCGNWDYWQSYTCDSRKEV